MTLGAKAVPFKESLLPSFRDVAMCPRTAIVLQIGSDATEASPAMLTVPATPQHLLGIQLCNVTIARGPSAAPGGAGGDHVNAAVAVNVCMQLMDGRGRPYGAVLPLAAFMLAHPRATTACGADGADDTMRQSANVSIPLSRDQRVALFLRRASLPDGNGKKKQQSGSAGHSGAAGDDAPLPPCVVTFFGHALCQFHQTTSSPALHQKLSALVKNAGIPSAVAPSAASALNAQPTTTAESGQLKERVGKTAVLGRTMGASKKRARDNDGVPALIPAFVAGGNDES